MKSLTIQVFFPPQCDFADVAKWALKRPKQASWSAIGIETCRTLHDNPDYSAGEGKYDAKRTLTGYIHY
jgi:hypothetical protein